MKALRLMLVAAFGTLFAGCYTLQPATAAVPQSGTRVAFAINDVGRVALGGPMGPELSRIEGTFLTKQADDFVVSVTGVNYLNGGFQSWNGETVRINANNVSAMYERKFSKARTILLVAGMTVAGTLLASKGLPSFVDPSDPDPGPSGETRRSPVPRSGIPPFLRSINPPRSH